MTNNNELRRISSTRFQKDRPDFKISAITKEKEIAMHLAEIISRGLAEQTIAFGDFLPDKQKLAKIYDVSKTTVQNAIRLLEDKGVVESKPRVGTIISNPESEQKIFAKLISKKESAVVAIKRFILADNMKKGDVMPSVKALAGRIGISDNTVRLCFYTLEEEGILSCKNLRYNRNSFVLEKIPTLNPEQMLDTEIKSEPLAALMVKNLKTYIAENMNPGDRLTPQKELAVMFNTSQRAVNMAIQQLIKEKMVLVKHGGYGTIVLKTSETQDTSLQNEFFENTIFARAQEAQTYFYEKILTHIRKAISEEYEVGDKLPTIKELCTQFKVSASTIKKAYESLLAEGLIESRRGNRGGTYLINMPEESGNSYAWLAVNPSYVKNLKHLVESN